jgi:serine/threonine-protein kinase RsbW
MIVNASLLDKITISSELKNLVHVESLIDKICEQKVVDEDMYGNILIAVTEAVNNAIIHGNCFDNNLQVEISVFEGDKELIFKVVDMGKGFDFSNLPDPTAPENIEKENGRGIFLIRNLADECDFDEPGNSINMHFSL